MPGMRLPSPLLPGRLIRRYKRFLADIALDSGEVVVAHCPNPGSMLGLADPGMRVWVSSAAAPGRKLAYRWELVAPSGERPADLVGINTGRPNRLAQEAIEAARIPELQGYPKLRREVRYGADSRLDLLLDGDGQPPCYVEVKSVTLSRRPGIAEFPDAVTRRGAKHLAALQAAAAEGARSVMLFLVQRQDCTGLAVAADIDPAYGRALESALSDGVEALGYRCAVSPAAIEVDRAVPLML